MSAGWLACVLVCATTAVRVAVVGGGIGGGSFSYYFKERNPSAEVFAFEARDYLGGRLKHVVVSNQTVEVGGDAWSKVANPYMVALAQALGQPKEPTAKGLRDPLSSSVGVWQGHELVDLAGPLLRHLWSDFKGAEIERGMLQALRRNYAARGNASHFRTIGEFLQSGAAPNLADYTAQPSSDFLHDRSIAPELLELVLDPLSRVIYDQPITATHAFATLVAVAAGLGADQFPQGNSVLVERLFAHSGARVALNTMVTNITHDASGFTVVHTTGTLEAVDYVVIAAPFEFTGISLPKSAMVPPPRGPFELCFVTVVRAAALSPAYFGLPSGVAVPFTDILVTQNASATTPFTTIQLQFAAPDGAWSVWKLFSNEDVTPFLDGIFAGLQRESVLVQHWPYTFPPLRPDEGHMDAYQPVELMPGLLYLNGLESVASAMEGSVIAGRNAALWITNLTSTRLE